MEITILLAISTAILAGVAIRRGKECAALRKALELASQQGQKVAQLRFDARVLEDALQRRDDTIAVLEIRLAALNTIEKLARDGQVPTFTQCAIRSNRGVTVFGDEPSDFARAVLLHSGGGK